MITLTRGDAISIDSYDTNPWDEGYKLQKKILTKIYNQVR